MGVEWGVERGSGYWGMERVGTGEWRGGETILHKGASGYRGVASNKWRTEKWEWRVVSD